MGGGDYHCITCFISFLLSQPTSFLAFTVPFLFPCPPTAGVNEQEAVWCFAAYWGLRPHVNSILWQGVPELKDESWLEVRVDKLTGGKDLTWCWIYETISGLRSVWTNFWRPKGWGREEGEVNTSAFSLLYFHPVCFPLATLVVGPPWLHGAWSWIWSFLCSHLDSGETGEIYWFNIFFNYLVILEQTEQLKFLVSINCCIWKYVINVCVHVSLPDI